MLCLITPPTGIGGPKPYRSDLAYLEDQFQLIEVLVRARKLQSSEEEGLGRGEQRKPEAVGRELRAKARGLQAKVEGRMAATRRSGGEGGREGVREGGRG